MYVQVINLVLSLYFTVTEASTAPIKRRQAKVDVVPSATALIINIKLDYNSEIVSKETVEGVC